MKGHQSARPETTIWLTPPDIIESLGPFDLDPCAAPSPRPWSTAQEHYELPQDGLLLPWRGLVWVNPPFGAASDKWLAKALKHQNALVLLPAATETERWFKYIWRRANGILFLEGRPHFYRPDGARAAANSGCSLAVVAYGGEACQRIQYSKLGRFVFS